MANPRLDPTGDPPRARLTIADEGATTDRNVTWDVLSERINDLIILADASGTIFYASPACARLGYRQHELIGRGATDFVHPDDLAHFQANHAALFAPAADQDPPDREHRIRRKDGSWVWMEGSPNMIRDGDGGPIGILNVFRDVSDRRATREALWEQTRRAALAEAVAGLGHWRLDAATRRMTWSEQVFHVYGLPLGREPQLEAAMAMTHPDDREAGDTRLSHALATGEGWAEALTRIVQLDGQTRTVSGRGICEFDTEGRVSAVVGTIQDVTEQRRAQGAIEESERRYRLLAENTTDMISRTSCSDGRLTYLSPSVERLTGYRVDELLGARIQDFVHPDDLAAFMATFVDLVSGDTAGGSPIRFRAQHKAGAWLWLESNPKLVRAPDGTPADIIDVTREVSAEQALKGRLSAALAEAEKLAEVKGEFLANMSHEIRTPLTAVLGFTGLLAGREDLGAEAQDQVERIAGAGRALLAIVNDVLDFSKLEAGQVTITPQPTATAALAREVMDMFEAQAVAQNLTLAFDAAPDIPPRLLIDGDRLRQILTNLIGNAVKFTERGGVAVNLSYDQGRGALCVAVTDSGPGISASLRDKLFERFSQADASSTRAKGGTGLGLAICRRLAEAMGGSISLRSRVGTGSTFQIDIPAPAADEALREDEAAAAEAPLEGLRVLVVDDTVANRNLMRAILEHAEIEVTEAADGPDAIELAAQLPVDVILMDLRMPGLTGLEAAQAIRAGSGPNRDTPILAFSAAGEHDLRAFDVGGPFDGCVAKPVTTRDLMRALRRAIAAPLIGPLEGVRRVHA